jgi:multicomponent Na+:H+ antiporter subunit D
LSPDVLLVLPIALPSATATALFLAWGRVGLQRRLAVAGAAAHLAAAVALLVAVEQRGVLVTAVGGWQPPFGIALVADLLSAVMVVLAALIALAVVVYSPATLDRPREAFGYYGLMQVLMMGVCNAFLTGDVFNLYVSFEVMLMASFVLLAMGGRAGQLEGSLKYVTLNLLSSALFLAGVGILYGIAGTLNMADLSLHLRTAPAEGTVTTVAMLFMVAFGIKAAAFPLFFWLPASYHTPPAAVSALFAGLLTKVGVYAMIRAFTLIFVQDPGFTHGLLLWTSGFTMVTGVLGAAHQRELRRILSFHIVSQIGYMLMGLALYTPLALAGSVFYLIHHILVKANLFLVAGAIEKLRGTGRLASLGGLYASRPGLALLFLVPALSLAGIPPLSGFWAKLLLVKAGLEIGSWAIVAAALVVSLLTLFSMTKIWAEAFWKAPPEAVPSEPRLGRALVGPILGLAALTVAIGLGAGPVLELSLRASEQLMEPSIYIEAVLGRGAR